MDPYLGQIQAFGFNFAPRGWALCDGQLLPISQNQALFSLLGTTYGGDGRVNFALPDLRGRTIVHPGQGPGLSNISWGEKGGIENISISIQNLPAHNHNVSIAVNAGSRDNSSSALYLSSHAGAFNDAPTPGAFLAGVNQTNAGGNQPIYIRNPYLGMYYCIALQGVFPSRN